MAQQTREVVLIASQTISANGNGPIILQPNGYAGVILNLITGTPTGTSPTLDVYIQQAFTAVISTDTSALDTTNTAIPTIFDDYAHFAQVTGTASTQNQFMRILNGTGTSAANAPTANVLVASSGALAASTVNPGPLGMFWRILWKVSGTSPSFPTVTLSAQFLYPVG
jgi:hypothetical protein